MSTLRDLQQRFADALFGGAGAVPAFVDGGADHAAVRLAIYRRAILANYRNALRATYPVVERLVGAPFFAAAVDAYVRAHPSCSGDLNVYGDRFGPFLATYPPALELPYLPDVARLEWAIDEVHRAPNSSSRPEAVLAALSAVAENRLPGTRLRVAPHCRLVASDHPILRIWQVNQPGFDGDDRVALDGAPADRLLICRDTNDTVSVERLPAGDFAWLDALAADATFAAAIDAATASRGEFDLGTALRAYVGGGTIAAVIDRD